MFINRYAAPEVREAHVIVPNRDEDASGGKTGWIYRWAAVVMKSGGDLVTMENFADTTMGKNSEWTFQMYGLTSKCDQTFHEQQASRTAERGRDDRPEYGSRPTTLRMCYKG